MHYSILVLTLLLLTTIDLSGQEMDSTKVVTLEMKNKGFYVGDLIKIDKDSIFFIGEDDKERTFSKADVKIIHEGILPSQFEDTPNSSVPFFVQSAIPNGNGNHYYKNYYIFGNEFNYGISNNLNLSFGFETATIIFDSGNQFPVLQVGAKYGVSIGKYAHAGISAKHYFNSDGSLSLFELPITFGEGRTNFTISPGMWRSGSGRDIFIFANLSMALSTRSRILVDFFRIDGEQLPVILYEYLFRSGFSVSLGGIVANGVAVPLLSFSVPFGNWKKRLKTDSRNTLTMMD